MKIKFIFELNNGTIITNDEIFNESEWEKNPEEDIGCVVEFKDVPMLQDYQYYSNKLWCQYLQFGHGGGWDDNKRVKEITTELVS